MEIQKLFHGGYMPVNTPDMDHSRSDIEFGKGFYLMADEYMASKWACKYRGRILNHEYSKRTHL